MSVNWLGTRPEGLLGLGHLSSLNGALLVVLGAAFAARRKEISSPLTCFLLGFGGLGVGYFVNQLVVCNTLMWSGHLSLRHEVRHFAPLFDRFRGVGAL